MEDIVYTGQAAATQKAAVELEQFMSDLVQNTTHNATAQFHHPSLPALLTNRCCRDFFPGVSSGDIQPEYQD